MSAPLEFADRARRLELKLEQPGRACGRWRKQAMALEETGRLRVSLLAELGQDAEEDRLPPRVPTSIPELWLRSAAPSRLLQILDRSEIRAQVTGLLLASVRSVEVREAEVVLELADPQDLRALKQTLDRSVALAQRVRREVERTPAAPSSPPAESERERLSPEVLESALRRNREVRRKARRSAAGLAAFVGVTALTWMSGHISAALVFVSLGVLPLSFLLSGLGERGAPACPSCGAYLSSLFVQRRCPRCDLFME